MFRGPLVRPGLRRGRTTWRVEALAIGQEPTNRCLTHDRVFLASSAHQGAANRPERNAHVLELTDIPRRASALDISEDLAELRRRMQGPQRHRLLHGYPLAAAMPRFGEEGRPANDRSTFD